MWSMKRRVTLTAHSKLAVSSFHVNQVIFSKPHYVLDEMKLNLLDDSAVARCSRLGGSDSSPRHPLEFSFPCCASQPSCFSPPTP